MNSEIDIIKQQCHVLKVKKSLDEIKFETLEGEMITQDHIILCGLSRNMHKFLIPLRQKYLKKFPTIVILNETLPEQELWMKLNIFQEIYFIQGSALCPKDLKKVNLQHASKVVLLGDSVKELRSPGT